MSEKVGNVEYLDRIIHKRATHAIF